MIDVLPASQRGTTRTGWLNSRHTFSFGQYRNPRRMGFGHLRVINDDIIDPGSGFGEHPHRDMEIITYVVEGALEHRDSLDNGSVIRPGDVQIMSAGSGIRHSEFNASQTDPCRFLQIWIPPNQKGLSPRYDQKRFPLADETGTLHLLLDPQGSDGSLEIHQDARMYGGRLSGDQEASIDLDGGRRAWVQMVRGSVLVNNERLTEGDGAAITDETLVELTHGEGAEVLVFDLA